MIEGQVNIHLLNAEDVEKEGNGLEEKDIRDQIIEFLKNKGYRHFPKGNDVFTDEIYDLFVKDDKLIEVIISDEIPEELIE